MLRIGQIWERNGVQFRIFDCCSESEPEKVMVKAPSDANWTDAVVYIDDSGNDDTLYIRQAEDFLTKYEFVSEPENDPEVETLEELEKEDDSSGE